MTRLTEFIRVIRVIRGQTPPASTKRAFGGAMETARKAAGQALSGKQDWAKDLPPAIEQAKRAIDEAVKSADPARKAQPEQAPAPKAP